MKNIKIKSINLKNKIVQYEKIITEKDLIINKEKIKNDDLRQLENIQNNVVGNDKIKELEEEIKLFRKYYNFLPDEKLIVIKFISVDQQIICDIIAKDTDLFSKIEVDLYSKNEKYKLTENYFLVNERKINKNLSLRDNKIKNNDVLTLCAID